MLHSTERYLKNGKSFNTRDHFIKLLLKYSLKYYDHLSGTSISYSIKDDDIKQIKEKEKETKHEMAAVIEITEQIVFEHGLDPKFVHFGLTSQDIINLAHREIIRKNVSHILSEIYHLKDVVNKMISGHENDIVACYTHGQGAINVKLEKIMYDLIKILDNVMINLADKCDSGIKFGGSVGGFYNLRMLDDKDVTSKVISFVGDNNLELGYHQSDPIFYADNMSALSMLNLAIQKICQDMWQYISKGYFRRIIDTSGLYRGSSTMPQKVNPINFEGAEGLAKMSYGISSEIQRNVMLNRLHRDLSDSSMLRFMVEAYELTMKSLEKMTIGFKELKPIEQDIDYSLYGELLQLFLKLKNDGGSENYHKVKDLFINKKITRDEFENILINNFGCDIKDEFVELLKKNGHL